MLGARVVRAPNRDAIDEMRVDMRVVELKIFFLYVKMFDDEKCPGAFECKLCKVQSFTYQMHEIHTATKHPEVPDPLDIAQWVWGPGGNNKEKVQKLYGI
eukprot:g45574.t1